MQGKYSNRLNDKVAETMKMEKQYSLVKFLMCEHNSVNVEIIQGW